MLLPWLFWTALGGAGVLSALHLLTRRQQEPQSFPPLHLVPTHRVRAMVVRLRASDPWLWLLRLMIVLLLGAGFAGLHVVTPGSVARIVLVEDSALIAREAGAEALVADALKGAHTALAFDASPRPWGEAGSGAMDAPRLSPALIAALRLRARLANRYETVTLTIAAGFATDSFDAATRDIRALWPGPVELIALPLVAALPPQPAAILHPPESDPGLWRAQSPPGRVNGVLTATGPLVAPFQRSRSFVTPWPSDLRPVAWWLDGAPAALERATPGTREIWAAFDLPEEGDALAQASFQRYLDGLAGERPAPRRLGAADLADFARDPAPATAPGGRSVAPIGMAPLAPWLLGLALLLMLAEPLLRRRLAKAPATLGAA